MIRALKMSVFLMIAGLMLLLSLAVSDLLVSSLTTDERTSMGLQSD
jgi:hypothetical protein